MPRHCSVYGCKSNYDSQEEKVSTFSLPSEKSLRQKWLHEIPTDLSILKNPVVCTKHFDDSDIIKIDKCTVAGELREFQRERPKLRAGAIPTIFNDVPQHISEAPSLLKPVKRRKQTNRIVFQCTWPGCSMIKNTCSSIELHVRKMHLGPKPETDLDDSDMDDDHEEEFYYTEVEVTHITHTSSPPTLSHRDMARPPHENPEYQKSLNNFTINHRIAGPISIPSNGTSMPQRSMSATMSLISPQKHMTLSVSAPEPKLPESPKHKILEEKEMPESVGYGTL